MNTTNCKKFKAEKAIKVNKMVLFLLSKFNLSVIPAKAGNPVIVMPFLDSAKASLRARLYAPLRPVEDSDALGGG